MNNLLDTNQNTIISGILISLIFFIYVKLYYYGNVNIDEFKLFYIFIASIFVFVFVLFIVKLYKKTYNKKKILNESFDD